MVATYVVASSVALVLVQDQDVHVENALMVMVAVVVVASLHDDVDVNNVVHVNIVKPSEQELVVVGAVDLQDVASNVVHDA